MAEHNAEKTPAALETDLGYRFRDRTLLARALTHPSCALEEGGPGDEDNQRLEFLGDAVLELCISHILYQRRPDMNEGELTRLRADLVNGRKLAALARSLGLGEVLRLGRGEAQTGGADRESNLADALEALLGAAYLDGGFDAALVMVRALYEAEILRAENRGETRDPKTALQEERQAQGRSLPDYRVLGAKGPPHQRCFEVGVYLDGALAAQGTGRSKKEAEQMAARSALEGSGARDEETEGPDAAQAREDD